MAPSPSSTQTPVRGRGRGRPRLRARGGSLLSSRKRVTSTSGDVRTQSGSGRRRPVYQNGYRPGGAGGGGRYIHPDTGEVVSAGVYNALKGATQSVGRPAPAASVGGADYKPREERSYAEFHPDLNLEDVLAVYSAEMVDGENYRPPTAGMKSIQTMGIKEETDSREDRGEGSMTSAGESRLWSSTIGGGSIPGSEETKLLDGVPEPGPSTATPSLGDYNPSTNGTFTFTTPGNEVDVEMEDAEIFVDTPSLQVTTVMSEKPLRPSPIPGAIAIDPTLASLTPPPPPFVSGTDTSQQIPTGPALTEPTPQAPQTPAVTPTEELASVSTQMLTVQFPGTPGPTPGLSRGGKDIPTLASLRAHRSSTGRPSRGSQLHLPPSGRGSRNKTNQQDSWGVERLNLPKPEYRRIMPFQFSEAAWLTPVGSTGPHGLNNPPTSTGSSVDSSMVAIGYQETARFNRPPMLLRDRPDPAIDEELNSIKVADRVEYDMDEQDSKWLTTQNSHRLIAGVDAITREVFEVTMTKIEKEWVALEKKIPKVIAKPHGAGYGNRRRSSGRVGDDCGEEEGGEDSKCAICDDGECENSNAIVFCDGCNLAVHQDCYGVPYIPEGQWLCRKCLTIPNKVAHCIFCPNVDGAFKQTTTTRWAHLLCAIWIPEVNLANPSYMEPVDGMELVPKSRWKLSCYICKQKMGACIQCSNKNCFIAFHVTCGRRARLHMRMKNSSGTGALLEASSLKAYCDKHVPMDWRRENNVDAAVLDAMEFYSHTMSGRQWGDSQSAAMALPDASEDLDNNTSNGILPSGNLQRVNFTIGSKRKRNQTQKSIWKLSSGAPVIPFVIYDAVVNFLAQFNVSDCDNFVAEACKYWTLKREARRGASLLKRLQLQMNSFTSAEVTKKNYSGMGFKQGTLKLNKRREFAEERVKELKHLKDTAEKREMREKKQMEVAGFMQAYADLNYFPEIPLIREVLDKAESFDQDQVFAQGFMLIRDRLENRLYPTVGAFGYDLISMLQSPPSQPILEYKINVPSYTSPAGLIRAAPRGDSQGPTTASEILPKIIPILMEAKKTEQELHDRPLSENSHEPKGNYDQEMIDTDHQMIPEERLPDSKVAMGGGTAIEVSNSIDDHIQGNKSDSPSEPTNEGLPENPTSKTDTAQETRSARLQDSSVVLPPLDPDPELGVRWDNGRPPWYLKNFAPVGLKLEAEVWSPLSESSDGGLVEELDLNNGTRPFSSSLPSSGAGVQAASSAANRNQDPDMRSRSETLWAPAEGILELRAGLAERANTLKLPGEKVGAAKLKNRQLARAGRALQKPELDFVDDEDLMGGFRTEDLPSPLGITKENASPELDDIEAKPHRHRILLSMQPKADLPGPPPSLLTSTLSGSSKDHEAMTNNGSVLSDPPDEDDQLDGTFIDGMEVDSPMNRGDEGGAIHGTNGTAEYTQNGTEESSPTTTSTPTPGRKSRKGMVFPRQSNGRFGPTKGTPSSVGSSKKVRRKKW